MCQMLNCIEMGDNFLRYFQFIVNEVLFMFKIFIQYSSNIYFHFEVKIGRHLKYKL